MSNHCTACDADWKLEVPEPAPVALSGTCKACDGEGFIGQEPRQECPRCKGRGFIVIRKRRGSDV